MIDTDLWINKAIEAFEHLQDGDTFVLKDLFEGVEWNKLSDGDRRHLGRTFKNKVLNKRVLNVRFIDRTKGSALYCYEKKGDKNN